MDPAMVLMVARFVPTLTEFQRIAANPPIGRVGHMQIATDNC